MNDIELKEKYDMIVNQKEKQIKLKLSKKSGKLKFYFLINMLGYGMFIQLSSFFALYIHNNDISFNGAWIPFINILVFLILSYFYLLKINTLEEILKEVEEIDYEI